MAKTKADRIMEMAANVALSEIGAGPEITGFSDRDEARAALAALVDEAANAPADPALLALAKLGAAVVRETESPRYAHSFTWDESRVLDILAHEAGVRVHVNPADQVLASGIAAAIARLLAPAGTASEGVTG